MYCTCESSRTLNNPYRPHLLHLLHISSSLSASLLAICLHNSSVCCGHFPATRDEAKNLPRLRFAFIHLPPPHLSLYLSFHYIHVHTCASASLSLSLSLPAPLPPSLSLSLSLSLSQDRAQTILSEANHTGAARRETRLATVAMATAEKKDVTVYEDGFKRVEKYNIVSVSVEDMCVCLCMN